MEGYIKTNEDVLNEQIEAMDKLLKEKDETIERLKNQLEHEEFNNSELRARNAVLEGMIRGVID